MLNINRSHYSRAKGCASVGGWGALPRTGAKYKRSRAGCEIVKFFKIGYYGTKKANIPLCGCNV